MKPRSCSKQPAASVILAVLLTTTSTEGAANMGLKKETWVPLCNLAKELGEVTSEAATEQKRILKLALDFRKEALQLEVYSRLAPTAAVAEKSIVLATYVASMADIALAKLQTVDSDNFLAAVAATSYAKGAIDEFITVAAQTKESDVHGCLHGGDGNPHNFEGKTIHGTDCRTGVPKTTGDGRTKKTITAGGIAGTQAGLDNSNSLQSANKNCRLFAKSNADGLGKAGDVDAAKLHYAAGYIEIDTGSNDGKVNLLNLNRPTLTDRTEATAWQAVITTVGALPKISDEDYTNTSDKLESTERAAKTIARIIKNVDDGTIANSKAAITNLFGATSKDTVDKLLSDAANYKLKDKIAGTDKETALNAMSTGQLEAILATLNIALIKDKEKLKQELTDAKQNKETKSAEDQEKECNKAGDNKGECDKLKGQGCIFKEDGETNKKCTLNKEAKQALEKANQETGGKDKKTDSKCTGKEQKDCKSPDCKWEGETCKDSSILLNKQFALMASAFVSFVAL